MLALVDFNQETEVEILLLLEATFLFLRHPPSYPQIVDGVVMLLHE